MKVMLYSTGPGDPILDPGRSIQQSRSLESEARKILAQSMSSRNRRGRSTGQDSSKTLRMENDGAVQKVTELAGLNASQTVCLACKVFSQKGEKYRPVNGRRVSLCNGTTTEVVSLASLHNQPELEQ